MKTRSQKKHLLCVSYHSTLPQNTGANVRIRNLLLNIKEMKPILLAPLPIDVDLNHRDFVPFQVPAWMRRSLGFNASILGCYGDAVCRRAFGILSDVNVAAVQCEHLWSFPLSRRIARTLRVPLILIEHNIETVYMERAYNVPSLANAISFYERWAVKQSDRVVVCSEIDANLLVQRFGTRLDKIWIVPNGINLPESSNGKITSSIPEPLRNKTLILFVGKTNYPPNSEAIRIISSKLAPTARACNPDLVFVIAGGPHAPDYSQVQNGLAFTGFVEWLEPLMHAAKICIAPLTSGSGTRLKILEYAAHAKPIVATSIAVEGLRLADKKEILIADDWDEFVGAMLSVVQGKVDGIALGRNAHKRVADEYQWKAIAANYEQRLLGLVSSFEDQQRAVAGGKIGGGLVSGKRSPLQFSHCVAMAFDSLPVKVHATVKLLQISPGVN